MTTPTPTPAAPIVYLSGHLDATRRLLPLLEAFCREALLDPLTGLLNRRATTARLASTRRPGIRTTSLA